MYDNLIKQVALACCKIVIEEYIPGLCILQCILGSYGACISFGDISKKYSSIAVVWQIGI